MNDKVASQDYQRKIVSPETLLGIIGKRPRDRSVIMCHGTFDLVHPGHIRHLMYSKDKADILIASLTSDAHVEKREYRPFVPENLRALNLAALEVVDYVVIDQNPTPIENIKLLQPDCFAKGYEYTEGGVHFKTQEEVDALNSFGGQMIFTPGDVVFSSSAFIDSVPPDISIDKLVTLMESEELSFESLRDALAACEGVKVHLLGDTIVDSYIYCTVIGSSATKTPTLSVKSERQVDFVGGAAVVAKHIHSAGGQVKFSTVLGDDELKQFILNDMDQSGIECLPFLDGTRPTTQKTVFLASNHHILKVDRVDNRAISEEVVNRFTSSLSNSKVDAFVFSDYRHGIFNRNTIPSLIQSLPSGPIKVADSQVASRWGNILDFQGFDLLTPNEREARFSLGDQDSVVRPLALELYKRAKCKTLILKMGERGILTYQAPGPDVRSFFAIDSFTNNVVDAMGAGDALLAYSTLVLTATKSNVMASILGSIAAAVACEREGNIPVSPEEVLSKINSVEQLSRYE